MRVRRTAFLSAVVASAIGLATISTSATSARFSATTSSSTNSISAATVTGTSSLVQACSASTVAPGTTTTTAELSGASTSVANGSNPGVAVTALTKAISSGDKLLIGQATGAVVVTASATAALGATNISFTSTAAAGPFAQGTLVTNLSSQNTSAPAPCKFHYVVAGTVSQDVAIDVLVASGDGSHPKLWDPSAAGLEIALTDGANNVFTLPTTGSAATCPSTGGLASSVPPGTLICGSTTNDVLSTVAVGSGTSFDLTLNWGLPLPAPSADQGGSTTIFVQFHAVQEGNNSLTCSPAVTQAGQPCTPTGSFSWS